MANINSKINKGYEDGFSGIEPILSDNEDYMSGYKIGQADGLQRRRHLKEKRKARRLDMRDWLNDKADYRNSQ